MASDTPQFVPPKPAGGRKTKLTPELQANLCEVIATLDLPLNEACAAAGIRYGTYMAWMKRGRAASSGIYHDFMRAVESARAQFERRHVENIVRAALDGEVIRRTVTRENAAGEVVTETTEERRTTWQASKFLLERRIPERYSEKLAVDQTLAIEQTDRKVIFEFHRPDEEGAANDVDGGGAGGDAPAPGVG